MHDIYEVTMSKHILPYRIGLGLVIGATAGAVIYIVFRRNRKKTRKSASKQNGYCLQKCGESKVVDTLNNLQVIPGEAAILSGSREEQLDLINRLDYVLNSISELRQEVETLRTSLHGLAEDIVGEVRTHLEENQRTLRRRRFLPHRERTDSTGSSSIYFTAASGAAHTDAESEGGYSTANAESDFDRESSRASEEEDEVSCETIRTMRRDSVDLVTDDEATTIAIDPVDEELTLLLQKSDELHSGSAEQQREGFQLLLSNKLLYRDHEEFLWRLARSYSDMCTTVEDAQEKKSYASDGKEEAEAALQKADQNAECHKWFAILCGQLSEHEGIQKRIQTGYLFKEHIEKAISLKPGDARCYYLLGRWCYEVSNLGWLERKTASALYENPPTATVHEALQNFLKAEDLTPGFSKAARILIAKCYKDLGNEATAAHWLKLAEELPNVTQEDRECAATIEEMLPATAEEEPLP
ncbi:regulator of microtubule dynamics protein 3 isoform X1 [Xenopus tropicalis]|uniref:Regulator of microtubule dynamics protein 3 n=1 Tax=Xenopus tropicalis TaxID=8364 RepID=A0A803JGE5_XENTR|nr:regulator of microtubule dynamics protein 3 isoform X1 [Xenopus tropicalis]